MFRWLKLSQHPHSGKLRPHEHTSYLPLGILLLVVGFALLTFTSYAASPPPAPSSVGIIGTMPGKPPTTAAVIKSPTNGQRFSSTPISISGTCPATTLVEVFKNNIFAGSSPCTTSGTFALETDLLIGANVLIVRVYDALNQTGPDSNAVTVYYDALAPQGSPLASLNFGGNQMIINTDAVFRGTFPNQEMTIPIDILGGRAPYALNIQWGDSTNKVVSRPDNATFRTGHTYLKAGTYQLSIQATDADGRVAFLTVASIVNGQPPIENTNSVVSGNTNGLLLLWPLYAATFATVVSFWLGEWREKRILKQRGLLVNPS